MESKRGHWKVYIQPYAHMDEADPNGTHEGITFTNGYAYVNWQTLGEEQTRVALDRLGHDPRFRIVEIPEKNYEGNSK